jgi:DHA1 family bicyclomycin/chloramphenicol resistance-like MFS transporter
MNSHYFDRGAPPHITTLVFATAVSALSMNIFLPSLPGMAVYFDADYAVVQLAVSLYLAATAVLQLFIGPASDRLGRRPVMLGCFVIFLVGTIAALYAPTIEVFLACRLLQAFSAAGMVLSRAIVRDTVGAAEAASRIGYVTMGMAIVPMIGPMIGGYLDEIFGWKAAFVLTLVFGVAAMFIVYMDLGETNERRSTSIAGQFRTYPELLTSRRFWGYSLTAAFTSGAFFAFLGGGPFVATVIYGLSPSVYGFYFGVLSAGYIVGNFISGRFSSRVGVNRMMLIGGVVGTFGVLASTLTYLYAPMSAAALFGPMLFVGMGNGITLPNANAGIVSVRPHLAGTASGLGGALQIGGGAALAALAGALLSDATGAFPLLAVMLLSCVASAVATLYVMYVARTAGALR